MNIYKFKIDASYGGGEIIVAAHSNLEAYGLVAKTSIFVLDYIKLDDSIVLPDITYNGTEPSIISCEYYIE